MRKIERRLIVSLACLALAACGPAQTSSVPSAAAVSSVTPTASPTAEPTASPTSTPVSTPTARPFVAADWGRLATPAFTDRSGTASMLAVATKGETVVAVGRGPTGAAAWSTGPDGTWRRAPEIPSFSNSEMDDVVASPSGGFVAVGRHGTDAAPWTSPDVEAAAWTSPDGSVWSPATVELPVVDPDGQGSQMQRVTAAPDLLVAVGIGRGIDTGPALWTSVDGRRWTIASDPVAGIARADDVTVAPDGRFVIVGASADEASATQAWSSANARRWTASPGIIDMWIHAVAPWRDGLVAVGSVTNKDTGGEDPAIAITTADGSWERVKDVPGSTADRDAYLSAVAATKDHLIATGPGPTGVVGIWISEDGRSWTLVDSPGLNGPEGEFEPTDLAVAGDQVIVVGDFPNGDSSFTWSAGVWTNPAPAQPAGPSPVIAAHPCPTGAPALIDVAEMTPEERLGCFAKGDLTLRGYLSEYSDPGLDGSPATPSWLADDTSCCRPFQPLVGMPQDVVFLPVAFDPSGPRPNKIAVGTAIEVTGHFDDSRSKTCRHKGEPATHVIRSCREQFVVTSLKRIDRP